MDTSRAVSQAKAAVVDVVSAQQAGFSQPCMLSQNQAKEADIRALSELTRALDKKVILFYIVVDHRNVIDLKN